jgi:potassium voltage-gated channel Eag-related subfamily H protein 7
MPTFELIDDGQELPTDGLNPNLSLGAAYRFRRMRSSGWSFIIGSDDQAKPVKYSPGIDPDGESQDSLLGDRHGEGHRAPSNIITRSTSSLSSLIDPRQWGVIDPTDSSWLLEWDIMIACAIAGVSITRPYEVAFLNPPRLGVLFSLERGIDVLFTVDILLQFVICFRDYKFRQGRVVSAKSVIVKNYLLGWFLVDVAGVFPVDILLVWAQSRWDFRCHSLAVRAARSLRLLNLTRFGRLCDRWDSKFSLSYSMLTLGKFFIIVTLVCHWMACIWGAIGIYYSDKDRPTSWLCALRGATYCEDKDVEQEHMEVYLRSIYWAIITLTSIGYGDITPQNNVEYMVSLVCSMVMASVWAYVIGCVCGIVSTLDPHEISFKRNMDDLNWMMKDVNMPSDMAQRFRKYLIEGKEMNKMKSQNAVIDQMSPQLQGECAMYLHEKWMRKVWYLQDMSREIVVWAARHLTLMVYAPHEEVLQERTLYIVRHGVCLRGGRILVSGDIWGHDMLLSNDFLRDKSSVKVLSYLHVLKIHISDLADIVLSFPEARLQLRTAQVKMAIFRGFKLLRRELTKLKDAGLPLWDIPEEARPSLYFEIMHGTYDIQEWLDQGFRRKDCDDDDDDNGFDDRDLVFERSDDDEQEWEQSKSIRSVTFPSAMKTKQISRTPSTVQDGLRGLFSSNRHKELNGSGPDANEFSNRKSSRTVTATATAGMSMTRKNTDAVVSNILGKTGSHEGSGSRTVDATSDGALSAKIQSLERTIWMMASKLEQLQEDLHAPGAVQPNPSLRVGLPGVTPVEELKAIRDRETSQVDFGSMKGWGSKLGVAGRTAHRTTKRVGTQAVSGMAALGRAALRPLGSGSNDAGSRSSFN